MVDVVVVRARTARSASRTRLLTLGQKSSGRRFESSGSSAHHVEIVLGRDLGRQRELVEILPGDDRASPRAAPRWSRRSCVVLPAAGTGYDPPLTGVSAVPMPQPAGTFNDGWMGMSRTGVWPGRAAASPTPAPPASGSPARSRCNPGARAAWSRPGNGQVKLVEVHVVAAPGEGLAVGGEHHAGNIARPARWACDCRGSIAA